MRRCEHLRCSHGETPCLQVALALQTLAERTPGQGAAMGGRRWMSQSQMLQQAQTSCQVPGVALAQLGNLRRAACCRAHSWFKYAHTGGKCLASSGQHVHTGRRGAPYKGKEKDQGS